jgi:peptide/nickel transport system substrate-binding protein
MRVVIEYLDGCCPSGIFDYMIEVLDDLGYRGSSRAVPLGEFYSARNEFQMAPAGWGADYPAASSFIVPLLTCDSSYTPKSGFCDPGIDAMIERASRVQIVDPTSSGALWAEIDREIVDQAPYLWLVNPIDVDFVSERVGNYQWSVQWEALLNQLWVR